MSETNNTHHMRVYEYERYLPTAFDSSLTLVEKVNKTIEHLNQIVAGTNDAFEYIDVNVTYQNGGIKKLREDFEILKKWLEQEGLEERTAQVLNEWFDNGKLANILSNEVLGNKADKAIFEQFVLSTTTQLQQTEQSLNAQLAQKALESDLIIERNRINNLTNLAEGSTTGDAELTDIRVGADGKTYDTAGESVRKQLTSVGGKISEINPKIQNKNFMTDGEIIEGYWIQSTGNYTVNATTKYIKIKVEPGENISFCRMDNVGYTGNVMGGIVFTDSTGNIIEFVDILSNAIFGGYLGYDYLSFDVPLEAKELRFTVKLGPTWDITSRAIVIKEASFDNYDANDIKVISIYNGDIADIKARNDIKALQTEKYYSGVKWVAVGDSLTGVNSRATINYVGYLTDELGFNSVNMGVSGTGYKRQDDVNNAFYQRILDVPTDADIVTIFGSFNDLGAGVPLGTKDDIGTDTLGGAINTTINNLYSILPTVPLAIIAPTPWIDQDISNQSSTSSQYVQLLKDICYDRGIPFLDLFHSSGLRPWESEYRTLMYSRDDGNGVHPDENGHKLITPKFAGLIKTLI